MNANGTQAGGGGGGGGGGGIPENQNPSLAHLNLTPGTPITPSTTPALEPQATGLSSSSELNNLLTESGLYPGMDGGQKGASGAVGGGKKPPYPTGSAINTTTPGSHHRPNPTHPSHQHPAPSPSSPSASASASQSWRYDPLASPDWDSAGPPGALCARRVKKDLSTIFTEPLPGIFAVPQEDNLFLVHCLIVGPFDTPYEGGFFHFVVRFGPSYPIHPPRVRLLTTGGGNVRFNPNLYKNGKVCLSILGTWPGPAWSPAANLSSVLLSLQSLLNEKPYHNEPGYDQERNPGDSARYNTIITHETLRVAVVQQLDNTDTTTATASPASVPAELLKVMESSFLEYYDHYQEVCMKNMQRDAHSMEDPFGEIRGRFCYSHILRNLKKLKTQIKATIVTLPTADDSPASSVSEEEDYYAEEEEEEEEEAVVEEEEEDNSGGSGVVSGGSGGV